MSGHPGPGNQLGLYLRDRRAKLDPAALGYPSGRRRTLGLRREEVAQRANISPTWYTCLEQGRGGAASSDVLERLSRALMLTDVEREHLFLLGLGHPPEVRYQKSESVTPRLQRVLNALNPSPAIIRTAVWDVLAWNRAATVLLMDYGAIPADQRNILRVIFLDPRFRETQYDWESVARFAIGAFRADAARAGAAEDVQPLVEDLCRLSADFERFWQDSIVHGAPGEGVKHIRHGVLGDLSFELSTFAVDGRRDLTMVVYNPATPEDTARINALLAAAGSATPETSAETQASETSARTGTKACQPC